MKKTYILMCVFLWLWGVPKARGQSIGPSTINAAGGSGTIGGNRYDWSIGEMTMVSTFTGNGVIITQGVLQNDPAAVGVQNVSMGEHLQVFPNPASTVVNLQYTTATQGTLHYQLVNMLGRTITDKKTTVNQGTTLEQINISSLAAATYMLEVSFKAEGGTEEMTSYKIDKLK